MKTDIISNYLLSHLTVLKCRNKKKKKTKQIMTKHKVCFICHITKSQLCKLIEIGNREKKFYSKISKG